MNKASIRHIDILALQAIKGCGPAAIRKVCDVIKARDVEISKPSDLCALIQDMAKSKMLNKSFCEFDTEDSEAAYKRASRLLDSNERFGIQTVSIFDDVFPEMLKSTVNEKGAQDAPLLLFYKGNLEAASMPSIAIIGSREASESAIKAGKHFAGYFAENGFNIASGLALGCDTAAHRGALEVNGATTAFLANGLDTIFPNENVQLADEILAHGGLLMSEYPVGTPATKYNLVDRDRLQAGLSIATIVIQTSIHGGTMHAAKATLAANKPLYAVRYNDMTQENVQGNIALVSQGAKYITSNNKSEILEALSKNLKSEDSSEPFKSTLF